MNRSRIAAASTLLPAPHVLGVFAIIIIVCTHASFADELLRVWVDQSGNHTIKATLIKVESDRAVLMTVDGRRLSVPIDRLSESDQQYISETEQVVPNVLRAQPPEPPMIKPLEVLDLAAAESVAKNHSLLDVSAARRATRPTELPAAIPADRAPLEIEISEQQFSLDKIDSHDIFSNLFVVGNVDDPALALSVSSAFSFPGNAGTRHRLLRLDANTSIAEVIWESASRVRMFDHHPQSKRSLILVGQDSRGHGGKIAIASGWDRGALFDRYYRAFSPTDDRGQAPHVRWARLIDDEHLLAIVDDMLVAANIVSGEVLYRIDGIDRKSVPAISGGRRFVAIPGEKGVDLYRTEDGDPLGRIGTESNVVPAVSFSQLGESLAIVTSRRMRIWSLPDAALRADLETRRSLGSGPPTWIGYDLVMSSSGILISIFRGIPVWRYEITGAVTDYVGGNVAILRKHPHTRVSVVRLPHPGAARAMDWIDAVPTATSSSNWQVPGSSVWRHGDWLDQNVRISARPSEKQQR